MHSEYYNLTSLYVIVNVPDPELYCDSNFKAFFSIQKNGFCFIRYFKRVAVYGHTNYGHRFFPNISKPLKPLAHDYSLESFKEVAAWPKQRLVLLAYDDAALRRNRSSGAAKPWMLCFLSNNYDCRRSPNALLRRTLGLRRLS